MFSEILEGFSKVRKSLVKVYDWLLRLVKSCSKAGRTLYKITCWCTYAFVIVKGQESL